MGYNAMVMIIFGAVVLVFGIAYVVSKSKINNNNFLFLYLCKINGNPFFELILTLHLVFLAITLIFLKSFMLILVFIIVEPLLLIPHKNILLFS